MHVEWGGVGRVYRGISRAMEGVARHWKAYSPIAKKTVWRQKSPSARRQLSDQFAVVCVMDRMLEEVEWMQVAAAVEELEEMKEERKEEAHGVVVVVKDYYRQPGKGSVTDCVDGL
jgi:hypothetical protein